MKFIKSQVTLIFLFLPIEQKKTAKLLHSNKGGLHGIVRELASKLRAMQARQGRWKYLKFGGDRGKIGNLLC